MQNLVLKLEYDGTDFHGWQYQPENRTVQGTLEASFEKALGYKVDIIGAGRTDSGVHSSSYIANLQLKEDNPIPEEKFTKILNSSLPTDINLLRAKIINVDFNARFSAIARRYGYYISFTNSVFYNRFSTFVFYDLEFETLSNVAKLFIGEHDFTSYSKNNQDTKSYQCNVFESYWERLGNKQLKYTIKANRFVYGMVRAVVGAMIDAARGKKSIDDLLKSLENQSREKISPLAAPNGLILEKIYYPDNLDFFK